MRELLRRAVLGSLRAVGLGAERVSATATALLRELGAGDRAEGLRTDPPPSISDTPLEELAQQVREILEIPAGDLGDDEDDPSETEVLRQRFQALLGESRSVQPLSDVHPAFERIIADISPDEARVIRLLASSGPQPAVHVCSTPWVGSGGQTILEHVSLICDRAGCHRAERGPSYLVNLDRLGVVEIVDEEIVGHDDYELIEARPEVEAALQRAQDELGQRGVCQRLTVRLTALGEQFCTICMPDGGGGTEPLAHRDGA